MKSLAFALTLVLAIRLYAAERLLGPCEEVPRLRRVRRRRPEAQDIRTQTACGPGRSSLAETCRRCFGAGRDRAIGYR